MDPFSSQMLTVHIQILSIGSFQSGQSALLERHGSPHRRKTSHTTQGLLPDFVRVVWSRQQETPQDKDGGDLPLNPTFALTLLEIGSGFFSFFFFFCGLSTASYSKGRRPKHSHIPI